MLSAAARLGRLPALVLDSAPWASVLLSVCTKRRSGDKKRAPLHLLVWIGDDGELVCEEVQLAAVLADDARFLRDRNVLVWFTSPVLSYGVDVAIQGWFTWSV